MWEIWGALLAAQHMGRCGEIWGDMGRYGALSWRRSSSEARAEATARSCCALARLVRVRVRDRVRVRVRVS